MTIIYLFLRVSKKDFPTFLVSTRKSVKIPDLRAHFALPRAKNPAHLTRASLARVNLNQFSPDILHRITTYSGIMGKTVSFVRVSRLYSAGDYAP